MFLWSGVAGEQCSRGAPFLGAVFLGTSVPGEQWFWAAVFLGSCVPGEGCSWGTVSLAGCFPGDQCSWGVVFLGSSVPAFLRPSGPRARGGFVLVGAARSAAPFIFVVKGGAERPRFFHF